MQEKNKRKEKMKKILEKLKMKEIYLEFFTISLFATVFFKTNLLY